MTKVKKILLKTQQTSHVKVTVGFKGWTSREGMKTPKQHIVKRIGTDLHKPTLHSSPKQDSSGRRSIRSINVNQTQNNSIRATNTSGLKIMDSKSVHLFGVNHIRTFQTEQEGRASLPLETKRQVQNEYQDQPKPRHKHINVITLKKHDQTDSDLTQKLESKTTSNNISQQMKRPQAISHFLKHD
jgi:hypothetical protein